MIVRPKEIVKYKGKIYTAGSEIPDEAYIDSIEFSTPQETPLPMESTEDEEKFLDEESESEKKVAESKDEEKTSGKNKYKRNNRR